jgi:tetratricopeptide (TPR) repeat protein
MAARDGWRRRTSPDRELEPRRPAAGKIARKLLIIGGLLVLAATAILAGRGSADARLQRLDEPALRAWVTDHPEDAHAHYFLGLKREQAGSPDEAAEHYRSALLFDPRYSAARERLGQQLLARGQAAEAEQLARAGLQFREQSVELRRLLASAYEAGDKQPDALTEWERLTVSRPRDAEAWYHLGQLRVALGQEEPGLAALRTAIELAPTVSTYRQTLAGAARQQGDYAEAETQARQAVTLAPNDANAHFELARVLRDRQGGGAEALAAMRRAVELEPENSVVRYALGAMYADAGRWSDAAREYEVTIRLLRGRQPAASEPWATWEFWLSQMEAAHFNAAGALRRLGQQQLAEKRLATFRKLSGYYNDVRRLRVRVANHPDDDAARQALARLRPDLGFPRLPEEE